MSFRDVTFPDNIARGLTGGPRFKNRILTNDAGTEKRLKQWSKTRRSWTVTLQTWDEARLEAIMAFIMITEGTLYAFRFKDWTDYYVGKTLVPGSGLAFKPAASAQLIGVGDGSDATWQIIKTYTVGAYTHVRNITHPRAGTLRVYVNGATRTETTHYTVNYTTGVITFLPGFIPASGHEIRIGTEFDVLARFDRDDADISLEGIVAGTWTGIGVVEIKV